jgi:ribosomal protein S7
LLSTFASENETQTRGKKLTASEILQSARQRLSEEFNDDPISQQQLRLAQAL